MTIKVRKEREDTPLRLLKQEYPLNTKIIGIISYSVKTFQAIVEHFFEYTACILCGEIHVLRIHAYLNRKILGSDGIMLVITIFSIFCIRARKQGKQYTKRILPPFVIPECNISFANLLIYIKTYPDGTINYDDAAYILGTYEEQTIRKHIIRGWKIVNQTILKILTLIAALPGFTSIPEKKPGKELLAYLEEVIDEVHQGCIRMGKRILHKPQRNLYLHMVYWFEKSRNPIICTLNHVFLNLYFYDTS